MVTQKRQRQRDSRQARVAAMRARRRRAQRRRLAVAVATSAVLVVGVSAFVAGGSGGKKVETTASTAARKVPVALTPVPPGASISGDTPCPKADGSSARTTQFAKPPPMCISPARAYAAEMKTTKGSFVISLDAKSFPNTVNNFVVLSRYHFYDGIPFHRVVPGFVIQGGDPQASGLGGPGYKFNDELPKTSPAYKIGSVAMANSGPNTNGSQFFVITGDAGANLPAQYSLLGEVTEGMNVVRAIEAVGSPETGTDPNGGKPTEEIKILSIAIRET